MTLDNEDIKRFYNIWFHLLDYTNEKYEIVPALKDISKSNSVSPEEIAPVRDKLWLNDKIIDEFVAENPFRFTDLDIAIVDSWRYRVSGQFILLKHLKNYSILLGNQNIYGVTGIVSPISEMFPAYVLPLMIDAVLIPFEGKIIYDSLLMPYQVQFGSGAKKGFQEEYRELKKTSGIITNLN